MRCPDCCKFVPYGEPSVDNIELELHGSSLTLSGELTLPCGECGTELASASMDADADVSEYFDSQPDEERGQSAEYEVIDSDVSATDRSETKDRHGKPIKNPRYMRRYYGVEATVTIRRTIKDPDGNPVGEPEDVELQIGAEEQAGDFESMA